MGLNWTLLGNSGYCPHPRCITFIIPTKSLWSSRYGDIFTSSRDEGMAVFGGPLFCYPQWDKGVVFTQFRYHSLGIKLALWSCRKTPHWAGSPTLEERVGVILSCSLLFSVLASFPPLPSCRVQAPGWVRAVLTGLWVFALIGLATR